MLRHVHECSDSRTVLLIERHDYTMVSLLVYTVHLPRPLHTGAVFSFKAMAANTHEEVNTVDASAVSWALHSCTVININATVPPTVASKTLTSVVSNKVLHEKNKDCYSVVASRQIWQEVQGHSCGYALVIIGKVVMTVNGYHQKSSTCISLLCKLHCSGKGWDHTH